MTPSRDYNDRWRLDGFEGITFTTEADAKAARELAIEFASRAAGQEYRNRRAAKRAKEATEMMHG